MTASLNLLPDMILSVGGQDIVIALGEGANHTVVGSAGDHQHIGVVCSVLDVFKEYYGAHCEDKTCAYDGIMELLEQLRDRGIKTAVVSNKADFAVQKLCEKYFKGVFDVQVGEREGVPRKPAPDSVDNILAELGISREDAVYVGDSDVDIMTARNAGMDEILVNWGFRGREFLLEHGAKCVVDKPEEILEEVIRG